MSLKIFLTADVHLGMKFAGYVDGVRERLVEARFSTLENLVNMANGESCGMFVVAGDLFDRISVARKDVHRAAEILKEFQGRIVLVLPGNHDFISTAKKNIWSAFEGKENGNIIVLKTNEIVALDKYDIDANVYPAPCHAKHSMENGTDWIKNVEKDEGVKYHIGVAHGSLEGFSPDFEKRYYPMSASSLMACGLDLWLCGHTHSQYPKIPGELDRIFYPATPEPDGFDCDHEGKAWILTIGGNKKIQAKSVSTGMYRFVHEEREIGGEEELDALARHYNSNYSKTLLKLKLKGRLSKDAYRRLDHVEKEIGGRLLHLQTDDSRVIREITREDIDSEFTQGSFPFRLLTELSGDPGDFESLQEAWRLIAETKK